MKHHPALAVVDIVGREDDGITQRVGAMRAHTEFFTCIMRDPGGRILLPSHAADTARFPAYDGSGFRQSATHRLYSEDALRGTIRITVAEPLEHCASVACESGVGLDLSLLLVVPLAVVPEVRASLAPLRRFLCAAGTLKARTPRASVSAGLPPFGLRPEMLSHEMA